VYVLREADSDAESQDDDDDDDDDRRLASEVVKSSVRTAPTVV